MLLIISDNLRNRELSPAAFAVQARSDARDGFEYLCEVTLALVPDHRGDLDYGKLCLREQSPCAFEPQVCEVDVDGRARDLFEKPREVVFRQISGRGYLFERKLAPEIVVHKLDSAAQSPVNRPGARQLYLRRLAHGQVRPQQVYKHLPYHRIKHQLLPDAFACRLCRYEARNLDQAPVFDEARAKDDLSRGSRQLKLGYEIVQYDGANAYRDEFDLAAAGGVILTEVCQYHLTGDGFKLVRAHCDRHTPL